MTTTTSRPPAEEQVTTQAAIRVRDLTMTYGTHRVLHGLDFDIPSGSVVALLGPNGAGKSTTVEILEGFRRRSGGQVSVLGVDPEHGDDAWRARMGIVLQSWRDHARWTVTQVLEYAGSHYQGYGTSTRVRPRPVADLVEAVGLTGSAHRELRTLSGGQRRRVDVALGIVGNPDLLFMDEPTTGFDPEARRDFHALIRELAAERATTILLTTHDLAEAEALADHILILHGGAILAQGSPQHLRERVGATTVSWTEAGRRRTAVVENPTRWMRDLVADPGRDVDDLQVERVSLEEAYLSLIREGSAPTTAPGEETR